MKGTQKAPPDHFTYTSLYSETHPAQLVKERKQVSHRSVLDLKLS